jgi:hypothetical protein
MKGRFGALKGQVSLEILFTTAIGLTFVALAFFYSMTSASDTIRITQASDAVNKIARAADLVYALGPGSKTTVEVLMPSGITNTTIDSRRVLIRVSLSSGTNDVFAFPRENVSGSLTDHSGRQRVTLTANSSGSIEINSTGQ